MSAKLVSITTRAGDDITPAPMATRDSTHRQAIRSLAESRDIVYSQQNRIAEAVFRERKNRIADAFVMAIGSYSHSRHSFLRERPRRLRRGGIAHRAKRGQTPVDLTLMLLCEYNRQYENRTANQIAPG